ncbi:DUF6199 family natural product biosynthesis protein [Paenibacillus glacialis]|uniref:DUF6199 domain-containing protein n=1 Tax=Paenibacillus glacialis TaxID=494026 RepID=A0A168MCF0_9BACL|nr:hypothetical protein PGLA_07580 [Paenibacillus glacialis]
MIFIGTLLIALGLLNILNPTFAWNRSEGWKVNGDTTPSDAYIASRKLIGIIGLIIGIMCLLIGILKLF